MRRLPGLRCIWTALGEEVTLERKSIREEDEAQNGNPRLRGEEVEIASSGDDGRAEPPARQPEPPSPSSLPSHVWEQLG